VKGTWREGFLAGDPEGYVEKALEKGLSFHRGPVWGTWRGAHLSGTLRAGERAVGDGASLSLPTEAPGRRHWGGGATSLWTLEDMLRKSPDAGISLHGVPFPSEGILVFGGEASYTGDFDRRMEGSSSGASLSEGVHEGDLEDSSFTGEPVR